MLKRLLGAEELARYQVAGLSGTSGGAVCALLAWYALLDGDPARAGALLDQFWADNSARWPVEMLVNNWIQGAGAWQDLGVALPAVSPYHWPASAMAADQFCQMLGRQVDFGQIQVGSAGKHPVLLMGAVDVLSGRFRTFNSRRDRITAATVLASAVIPNLFRAVRLEDGTYWDGLFSQNPPSVSFSMPAPTSCPATCRCIRNSPSSRRLISCSKRDCWTRAENISRSWCE